MSEEINQSRRSPNSPKISIAESLPHVEALYKKAGRSPIKAEIAAGVLGYSGLTGSSATLLGALNQYGLIDRSKGDVQVTPLAMRIIHPVSETDRLAALREVALAPKAFVEIHEKYKDTSEEVLANQLIHDGFAEESARRVAAAYKANVELAKLLETAVITGVAPNEPFPSTEKRGPTPLAPAATLGHALQALTTTSAPKNMLASFKIPLPLAEAEFIFTGEKLEAEDFDQLVDYIELFKKQYLRKQELRKLVNEAVDEVIAERKTSAESVTTPSALAPPGTRKIIQ